jgi:hypothetical protein
MKSGKIFLFFLIAVFIFNSCSVSKFIPPNKQLLKKYTIKYDNKKNDVIDNSEVKAYLRPKPNSHFLSFYYSLYLYYLSKSKPTKFYNWLNRKLGEEPVYLEDVDPERLAMKMQRFLSNSGFFNTKVSYEIIKQKKKSKIVFTIYTGEPYRIDTLFYSIPDSTIRRFVYNDLNKSLIKKGDIYNSYTLDDERDRITADLQNVGYYYFNRNYVNYEIDSNFNNHRLSVKTIITNRKLPDPSTLGSFIELPHERYFIKKVEVIPDYNPVRYKLYKPYEHIIKKYEDSVKAYPYTFLFHEPSHRFKPNTFDQSIMVKPGVPYSNKDVRETYRRLFGFPIVKTATISFDTTGAGNNDSANVKYLNSKIQITTGKLNFYSIEGVLTNSSGDPGVRGNLVIANKNIFRRAEVLRVRLNGGFEAQSISSNDSTGIDNSGGFFNTFEAGIDASIIFPRFFSPIPFRKFRQKYHPTTSVTFGFNYMVRPNYSRNSTNLLLNYQWKKNKKLHFIVSAININFVNVNPTPEFQDILDQETNQRLKEQYSDHLIAGINISMIYDNQKIKSSTSFDYIRLNFETSGNFLYGIEEMFGIPKTSEGYYKIFGVRYSQFVRINLDYRHYFHLYNPDNIIAIRGLGGIGIAYLNSSEIPYEKSFYAGGANDMRGWRFRTLGPGAYSKFDDNERLGELQLETNIEFRFNIYSFFKGAFFTDIGNIWSSNTENFPGGQFRFDTFYKQLAVDVGAGARFDFTYFIFRLDAGIPIVDPAYPSGSRWRFNYLRFSDFIVNFGIGYPF